MPIENVYTFIKGLEISNKEVIAAISGGPDSMLLLDILINLRDKLNFKIIVAHVHHNLRKESDYEAIMLEEFCKKNKVTFEMMKINKYPNNKFSEEAARKIRYKFFDEIVKKYNTDILFTAHHGDDLIEGILMRITRGSTLKGYAGIEMISTHRGYKIARPLLYLTKADILEILNKKNIKFAVDMSNEKDDYTRNRFRKYILPELKKENPQVHYKFLKFSQKILLADSYIQKETDSCYRKIVKDKKIKINSFNSLDEIIRIYLLEKYLREIYGDDVSNITAKHLDIIMDNLIKNGSIKFHLPLNKIGIIEYNEFKVVDNEEPKYYEYTFYDKIEFNGKRIVVDNTTNLTTNYVIHLNSNEIELPFHVRCKKPGDRMYVKNMNGSRKVSDIFTDIKMPKEIRDTYPIVTDSTGKIIWIPGVKKSNFDRKKNEKYDIILKYD